MASSTLRPLLCITINLYNQIHQFQPLHHSINIPAMSWKARELEIPSHVHLFTSLESLREYLGQKKADVILIDWHRIKNQLGVLLFGKCHTQ